MKEHPVKALSVRQPWADCIIHHGKDIENRQWRTGFRGRVYIHAAKAWGRDEREAQEQLAAELDWQDIGQPLLGGIIGTVEIVDCVEHSDSWWFAGRYGFVLRDPRPLDFMPCRGALGFFTPDLTPPKSPPESPKAQGEMQL